MKRFSWQIILGLSLITLSVLFYFAHYAIFKDAHHIFLYLIGDIAFVPIEVLFVTLIIHRLLNNREKRAMLKKMNMVIGVFFSEVGTKLLKSCSEFDPGFHKIQQDFTKINDWSKQEFSSFSKRLKQYDYQIISQKGNLEDLQNFLINKMNFLLGLLQNPNLLEHESFTELLWAVFHLAEELSHRSDVKRLPDTDLEHLSIDINRAYSLLTCEWLAYMKHLKNDYPYLFSLAMRINPFVPNASPEVK